MNGMLICLAAAAIGVDYGWQPVEGGGIEYIIQIEPQMVDSLKSGRDIFSDLPKTAQPVRSYRITVGTGRLPHHGEAPPDSAVVPAGGEEESEANENSAQGENNEIDLSQLPGPVLRPAMTVGDAKNQPGREPRRLAAEAEPMKNRISGYHSTQNTKRPQKAAEPQPEPAIATEVKHASPEAKSPSDAKPAAAAAVSAKPWALELGLFTSLAGNAFLLWVATGQRSRYRALVRRMFAGQGYAAALTAPAALDSPRWEPVDEPEKASAAGASEESVASKSD